MYGDHCYVSKTDAKLHGSDAADPGSGQSIAVYTVSISQKPLGWAADPRDRDPILTGGGSDLTRVYRYDLDGNAVANSAGDFLSDIPEFPVPNASDFTITRNERDNPQANAAAYSNTLNVGVAFGYDEQTLWLGKISYAARTEVVDNVTVKYWEVVYPFRYNPDGWRLQLIDAGYRSLDGGGDPQQVTDDVGQQCATPVLLNGSGGELAPGAPPVLYPTAGYKMLPEVDWSPLGLPDPSSL